MNAHIVKIEPSDPEYRLTIDMTNTRLEDMDEYRHLETVPR